MQCKLSCENSNKVLSNCTRLVEKIFKYHSLSESSNNWTRIHMITHSDTSRLLYASQRTTACQDFLGTLEYSPMPQRPHTLEIAIRKVRAHPHLRIANISPLVIQWYRDCVSEPSTLEFSRISFNDFKTISKAPCRGGDHTDLFNHEIL